MDSLQQQYCPPLDTSLVAAIVGDTDNPEDARGTLDILKAEAIADGYEDGLGSDSVSVSEEGDYRSTELSSLNDEEEAEIGNDENLRFLKLSFPSKNLTGLKFTLTKCQNDVLRAVDELLNHELIDEEKRLNAIIDGDQGTVDDFFDEGRGKRRRQRQKKQRADGIRNELDPGVIAGHPPPSQWQKMDHEVEWLATTLSLSKGLVQSSHHSHGSSLPGTLHALLESQTWEDTSSHPDHDDNFKLMMKSFPSLGVGRITDILSATKEQIASAKEVAVVLLAWRPTIGSLTSSTQKTPIKSTTTSTKPGSLLFDTESNARSRTTTNQTNTTLSSLECKELAADYCRKRDAAFRQAAAAHQSSRSNHLVGGAAMYYSQIGREYDAKMREYDMLAAKLASDASMATTTNTHGVKVSIDLHGCTVHQALVLLRPALNSWYAQLRGAETGSTGFSVITGVGNHSSGGEAKILPAVQKWLSREGWRYTVTGGQVLVKGLERE